MFDFDYVIACRKKSKGTNAIKGIVLHHTGGGTFESNLRVLSGNTDRNVSCHFVIGPDDGQCAKIGMPTDIQWHAGESQWGSMVNLNQYFLGIEVVSDGKNFTDYQRKKTRELIQHLKNVYAIPTENIVTHASITWAGSPNKKLWDGKSPSRKRDCGRNFRANEYPSFTKYRESFK